MLRQTKQHSTKANADRLQQYLKLCRPQIGEASAQQVTDKLMDKDSIVWVGIWALCSLIPKGCLDDPTVHNGEEVMQNLDMKLETWLVKAICNSTTHRTAWNCNLAGEAMTTAPEHHIWKL